MIDHRDHSHWFFSRTMREATGNFLPMRKNVSFREHGPNTSHLWIAELLLVVAIALICLFA